MNLTTIGFVVTVLAVLLAVPLSVAANLLTPKVRDWYSTTSQKRLKKRLAALKPQLALATLAWTFTPAEWALFVSNFRATVFLLTISHMFTSLAGGVLAASRKGMTTITTGPHAVSLLLAMIGLAYIFNFTALMSTMLRYREHRRQYTVLGRMEAFAEFKRLVAQDKSPDVTSLVLVEEITRLLEDKEQRLGIRPPSKPDGT